jgi:hypothetical protein
LELEAGELDRKTLEYSPQPLRRADRIAAPKKTENEYFVLGSHPENICAGLLSRKRQPHKTWTAQTPHRKYKPRRKIDMAE